MGLQTSDDSHPQTNPIFAATHQQEQEGCERGRNVGNAKKCEKHWALFVVDSKDTAGALAIRLGGAQS